MVRKGCLLRASNLFVFIQYRHFTHDISVIIYVHYYRAFTHAIIFMLILFRAFTQSIKTTAFANTSFEPYKVLLNNYLITY